MQKIKKISVTGPESSGKTTLARALAQRLNTLWVPEYARLYLQSKGPQYSYEDYLKIAEGQMRWEQLMEQRLQQSPPKASAKRPPLITDTGALVLKIWGELRFGRYPAYLDQALQEYDLFLLCAPDIPFEPDPLREHPHLREKLFEHYLQHLKTLGKPFQIMRGGVEERVGLVDRLVFSV